MHRSIDIKSVLIGGLLVALVLFLTGTVPYANPEEYGRFQIAANENHAFILDSATGQVWTGVFPAPGYASSIDDTEFHTPKTEDSNGNVVRR